MPDRDPRKRKPPTLREAREILLELYRQIENVGADTYNGKIYASAYYLLDWLLYEFFTPDD